METAPFTKVIYCIKIALAHVKSTQMHRTLAFIAEHPHLLFRSTMCKIQRLFSCHILSFRSTCSILTLAAYWSCGRFGTIVFVLISVHIWIYSLSPAIKCPIYISPSSFFIFVAASSRKLYHLLSFYLFLECSINRSGPDGPFSTFVGISLFKAYLFTVL